MHYLEEETVKVDFCRAETLMYDTLVRICREKINGMSDTNTLWMKLLL